MVLSHKLSEEELQELREAFEVLDSNRDGCVSLSELRTFVLSFWSRTDDARIKSVFLNADADGNGVIDFEEFVRLVGRHYRQRTCVETYTLAFKALDLDGDGYITTAELKRALSGIGDQTCSQSEAVELVREADMDGDGRISYQEFVQYLMKPGVALHL